MYHHRGFRDWPALLSDLMERVAPLLDQPHLEAVRDGLSSLSPVLIIGSMSLLLRELPLAAWQAIIDTHTLIPRSLQAVHDLTYGSFSLWAVGSISSRLARRRGMPVRWTVVLAALVFGVLALDSVRPTLVVRIGLKSLALAIGVALLTVEACARFIAQSPASTDARSSPRGWLLPVKSALSALVVIGLAFLARLVPRLAAFGIITSLGNQIVSLFSSGPACVLAEAAHSLLWVAGIDGNLILGSALQTLLTGNAVANGVARWSGQMPGWIYTELFRIYVTAGGSGATLPLAFFLSRSKSTRLRRLGRASLPLGLVNRNAGLIFGAPIVFNPLLALPFLTTTVLNAAVAYLAHIVGWVTPAYIYLPRTIPPPLYALISTGYDVRAVALSVVTWLVIPGIIWLPFFRFWEKRILIAETIQDQPETKGAWSEGSRQR